MNRKIDYFNLYVFLLVCLFSQSVKCSWSCKEAEDCVGLEGATCFKEQCTCNSGQHPNFDTTKCIDAAPYFMSPCQEDGQCVGLVSGFFCSNKTSMCECKPGFHYLRGRCWPSSSFGDSCVTSEQCHDPLLPFSLGCKDKKCACADNHYQRQKGECRKIATAIGDECVVNEDCQVKNETKVICDTPTLKCALEESFIKNVLDTDSTLHTVRFDYKRIGLDYVNPRVFEGDRCINDSDCEMLGDAMCSEHRHCVCRQGYFPSEEKDMCMSELGMPAKRPEYCTAKFGRFKNGVCDCPNGYFYEVGNRDCIKAMRSFSERCQNDAQCYTFGREASCFDPENDGFNSCQCNPDTSIKDEARKICKTLDTALDDKCEVSEDCPQDSVCNESKVCKCESAFTPSENNKRCLKANLGLGETCVESVQCSKAGNSACSGGKCDCKNGYFQIEGKCEVAIGGECVTSAECKVENSFCHTVNATSEEEEGFYAFLNVTSKCKCEQDFVAIGDTSCLRSVGAVGNSCQFDEQCWDKLGGEEGVDCVEEKCQCKESYHHRDGYCWRKTELGRVCAVSSQCFLNENAERTECRNSICQCRWFFEEQRNPDKCNSSTMLKGTSVTISLILTLSLLIFNK